MQYWMLQYDFHLYNINMECKEVITKREFYERVEDMLRAYREKKEALFMGIIKYNTDFHIYKCDFEEVDTAGIDILL